MWTVEKRYFNSWCVVRRIGEREIILEVTVSPDCKGRKDIADIVCDVLNVDDEKFDEDETPYDAVMKGERDG